MPSTRALRRHHRARALQKRYRIVRHGYLPEDFELTYKCRHWHLRCNCMGQKDGPLPRDLRRLADLTPGVEARQLARRTSERLTTGEDARNG